MALESEQLFLRCHERRDDVTRQQSSFMLNVVILFL